ncbi:Delta-sarcoglycan [Pseudolycoriella hygida]|uniref:Delta-sarcoglycan n=1 Tax=Pseudolycoriella hygida TaxID=35572 RepID=A0A9Q0S134_9DIPT|nr:Delta-sarcoglycan [Pseudolycoriella hygida]
MVGRRLKHLHQPTDYKKEINHQSDIDNPSQNKRTLKLDLLPDDETTNKSKYLPTMSSAANNINQHNTTSSTGYHIGLYGWRKKCLFILILGLMILIIVNLALTLWILKVMEFSSEGMGQLKVVTGGLQVIGQTLVLDILRASTIKSRYGQAISLESSRNFSINTRDWEGNIENNLFLGHDKMEVLAHSLKIKDTHGAVLFSADKNEVIIGANTLRVDGDGGAVFKESVQTSVIRAEPGRELKFDSPTRSLHVSAGQDIFIKSGAGSIDASCLNDIRLHSEAGNIRLDSASVFLPNLKIAQPPTSGVSSTHEHNHKIYQLCVCGNGKLFLALSHSICAGDESTERKNKEYYNRKKEF